MTVWHKIRNNKKEYLSFHVYLYIYIVRRSANVLSQTVLYYEYSWYLNIFKTFISIWYSLSKKKKKKQLRYQEYVRKCVEMCSFFPQNSTRAHPQKEHINCGRKLINWHILILRKCPVLFKEYKNKSSSTNWIWSVVDDSQNEYTKWHSIIEMNENSPLLKKDLFVMKLLLFEQWKKNRIWIQQLFAW